VVGDLKGLAGFFLDTLLEGEDLVELGHRVTLFLSIFG
jgi:hypothetical protein